jgi:hypothetical protein
MPQHLQLTDVIAVIKKALLSLTVAIIPAALALAAPANASPDSYLNDLTASGVTVYNVDGAIRDGYSVALTAAIYHGCSSCMNYHLGVRSSEYTSGAEFSRSAIA